MASSESVDSEGLVASRENLRQNVLLATSGTIDATKGVRNSKLDLAQIDDNGSDMASDDQASNGFWNNLLCFRSRSKCKTAKIEIRSNDSKPNSEIMKCNSHKIGSVTSLAKNKNQIDAEKCLTHGTEHSHSIDDTGDCISELIGHIGLWQVVWVIFLVMFQVPSAFHIFSFMFQAVEREFWCAVPAELESTMNLSTSEWRRLSQPKGACTIAKNLTKILQYDALTPSPNETIELLKCTHFVFDNGISDTTIQSEWNVVCEDSTLLHIIEMCFLAGAAIGSLSSGSMSDEYGRRHTLMIVVALQATIGTALGIVQTLLPYMILRFALGFVSMSIVNISFVLTVEMVTGKWSSIIGTLDLLPLPLAYISIAGIAYSTRNWRHLQLIVSIPWFGFLFFWYVLPESPRWLLAKGRIEELKPIIETAARWNKKTLPPNYEKTLIVPEEETSGSLLDLFKAEYLRTTLLLLIAWYALVLQYMAITLHIGEMGGNIYLITVYAGIFESIAIIISIFTVTRYGIQRNIFYNILLAGISLMYVAIFPNADWTLVVALSMLGKSTTGVANAMIPAFTSFQYPPTLRTRAMGLTNFSAGFALVSVPYIWLLKHIEPYLPPLLLGLCGLIGALVLFFIDDRTEIMLAAERRPKKLASSHHQQQQQQTGKQVFH